MTREQLVGAIYENNEDWSCPSEYCFADTCLDCADLQLTAYEAEVRAKAIEEVISLARVEIDFESQAEQKRFIEFMRALKEQK